MDAKSIRDMLCRTAVVALFALPSAAQAVGPVGRVPALPELVTLQLSVLDGPAVTVTVREGRMATFAPAGLGVTIGIVPRVIDREAGRVELELSELSGTGPAAKVARRVGQVHGQVGFRTVTAAAAALPLDVRVVGIGSAKTARRSACAPSSTVEVDDGDGDPFYGPFNLTPGCCITCWGSETCGCSVSTICGSCNDPFC